MLVRSETLLCVRCSACCMRSEDTAHSNAFSCKHIFGIVLKMSTIMRWPIGKRVWCRHHCQEACICEGYFALRNHHICLSFGIGTPTTNRTASRHLGSPAGGGNDFVDWASSDFLKQKQVTWYPGVASASAALSLHSFRRRRWMQMPAPPQSKQ